MKQKGILFFMAALVLVLCSCGKKAQAPSADSKEIVEIIWQYPSPGDLGPGFQEMEDALNAMMERDIGVHVRFEPVPLMESQQKAVLMVSSGEKLDIALTAFTSLGPVIESGLIIPLDDLVNQYGQDLIAHCGVLLEKCNYGGKLYGIPPAYVMGEAYGYMVRDDILKKHGITVDETKLYTLADIEAMFEKVKTAEGPNFYCTIPWNTETAPLNNSYIAYDKVMGSFSGGVLMLNRSFTDLTITNLFETEEYKNYAQMMYRWAQKGYISPDAAVTSDFVDTLLQSGNYLGMMYWHQPKSTNSAIGTMGLDLTCMKLVDAYVQNEGGMPLMWNVASTSTNPAKAVQALNYIYQHKEAAWLMQFGLEGKSYEVVEDGPDGKVIKYLAEDTSTLPYHTPYGLWGDRLEWPAVYPSSASFNRLLKEKDAAIPKSRYSPAIGYSFVQEPVTTEVAAVNTVIAQYAPGFNSGSLNPDTALPEFISALKAAGIDKVIAENQRQINEWVAAARENDTGIGMVSVELKVRQ
ncbi:MAG: ABC transporter substrate-binding protein [Treponema sp.]|jgi:putative aldouronate transport system substrate-binding protein|nr:ABC transporter substrate-binding protein [Treponema sp.]